MMGNSCQVSQGRNTKTTKNQEPRTKNRETASLCVWKFTNGRELDKSEFINYFERKVFRTIRKFQMLPTDTIFKLKKSNDLNTLVLKQILSQKFQVKESIRPNISTDNLSQEAENIFKNIIKGEFKKKRNEKAPLLNLSDKEVELYCNLKNIKGEKREQSEKIQNLFKKFLNKNQDLEVNILKAQNQLDGTT